MIRTLAMTCLMSLAAGAVATSADAKTIFETATFTGIDTGEYIVSDSRYFGVAFTLDKTTEIRASALSSAASRAAQSSARS